MTTDPFEHDDAAYVLGALSVEDRAAFEAHLEDCADCSRRVAELRPVVGVLAGLDGDVFDEVADPVPETLLPGLLRTVRSEQRRRRRLFAGLTGLAAASVIALSVVLVWPSGQHPGHAQAMVATVATPVQATATLSSVNWGTKIELACRYASGYPSGRSYALVVIDKQGVRHDAGSWKLAPEHVTHFTTGTALARDQIAKIEIMAGATPVLQLNL
jgi:anti-sigma-K factor RskA